MAHGISTSRLLRESAPVAAVLFFWVVLSWLLPLVVATGVRYAGIVMALLYVVVRGVALAQSFSTTPEPDDVGGVLRENATVAVGAGAWFLLGVGISVVEGLWDQLGLPGVFTSPADGLAFVFTTTGVATVILYAVAVGVPRVRAATTDNGDGDRPAVDTTPVDD